MDRALSGRADGELGGFPLSTIEILRRRKESALLCVMCEVEADYGAASSPFVCFRGKANLIRKLKKKASIALYGMHCASL